MRHNNGNMFGLNNHCTICLNVHDQAMEGARLAGASRIFGVDINPAKYEQGTSFINCCQYHLMCKMTVWYMFHDADGTLNLPTCSIFFLQLRNLAALISLTLRTTTSQCKRY